VSQHWALNTVTDSINAANITCHLCSDCHIITNNNITMTKQHTINVICTSSFYRSRREPLRISGTGFYGPDVLQAIQSTVLTRKFFGASSSSNFFVQTRYLIHKNSHSREFLSSQLLSMLIKKHSSNTKNINMLNTKIKHASVNWKTLWNKYF